MRPPLTKLHVTFSVYNKQDSMFHSLFISVTRSTCFRRFFRPSSGAQKLHIQRQVFVTPIRLPAASLARLAAGSSKCLRLYVQFCAPDDGRTNRLKHAERLTEINKFEKSCTLLVIF